VAATPPQGTVDDAIVLRWRDAGALELGLVLWLREPGASPRELVVGRLRPLLVRARAFDVPIVLGVATAALDEAAVIVRAEGLAGVHLRGDPDRTGLEHARARMPGALLGRSSHDADAGDHALVAYTCFGPVFGPRTRMQGDDKRPHGLPALERCATAPDAWVLALGGIEPDTARECVGAGARGVAGISAFFAADDPALARLCAVVRATP